MEGISLLYGKVTDRNDEVDAKEDHRDGIFETESKSTHVTNSSTFCRDKGTLDATIDIEMCVGDGCALAVGEEMKSLLALDNIDRRLLHIEADVTEIITKRPSFKQVIDKWKFYLSQITSVENVNDLAAFIRSIKKVIFKISIVKTGEKAIPIEPRYTPEAYGLGRKSITFDQETTKADGNYELPGQTQFTFNINKRRETSKEKGAKSNLESIVCDRAFYRKIFVTGFPPDTPEEEIEIGLARYHGYIVIAYKLDYCKGHYASFCVSVFSIHYEELLKPKHWPKGIVVRPFCV